MIKYGSLKNNISFSGFCGNVKTLTLHAEIHPNPGGFSATFQLIAVFKSAVGGLVSDLFTHQSANISEATETTKFFFKIACPYSFSQGRPSLPMSFSFGIYGQRL
jgi:hypothetical protein